VLAGADVSFAFARGATLAHRSADFIMTSEALMRVPETIAVARQTRRVMRQNLSWALAYNVIAIPFAAAGLVEPWLAALGMAVSSLAVSLNALRLRSVSAATR
jgi:Cu2+-exporting ATPase